MERSEHSTDSEEIRSMRSMTLTRSMANKCRASVKDVNARFNLSPSMKAKNARRRAGASPAAQQSRSGRKFFEDSQNADDSDGLDELEEDAGRQRSGPGISDPDQS